MREKKVKYIHLEKKILAEILVNSPYFVKLAFTFQDEDSLCKARKLFFGLLFSGSFDIGVFPSLQILVSPTVQMEIFYRS